MRMEVKTTHGSGGREQAGSGWERQQEAEGQRTDPASRGRGAPVARSGLSLAGEGRGRLGDEALTSDLAEPIGDWAGEGA